MKQASFILSLGIFFIPVTHSMAYRFSLSEATYLGKYDYLVQYLNQSSSDDIKREIDRKDQYGLTPLMLASVSLHNSEAMVQALLPYHPDLNQKDPQGRTAAMLATLDNKHAVVHLLLKDGSYDETCEDQHGHSFEDFACITPQNSPLERKEKIKLLQEILSYKLKKKNQKRKSLSYAKTAIEHTLNAFGPIIFSADDIAEMIAKYL